MRYLLCLFALLCLTVPGAAQAVIDDLYISRDGDLVNIRVNLRNTGTATQRGPLVIEVFARQDSSQEWAPVISWPEISKLAAGHRVSRDFFSEDGDTVSTLAARGLFEVRATLTGPDLYETTERTAHYDPDHQH